MRNDAARVLKASFNIHGLPLEVVADHPALLEVLTEDLRAFRRPRARSLDGTVRLTLTALPESPDSRGRPIPPWVPSQEIGARRLLAHEGEEIRYGRVGITISYQFGTRRIRAAVVPTPFFVPDPMYHYCFTRPVSLWLKERGRFFVHAACVSHKAEGILLVGPPGAGKSTLSLAAVREGFQWLGDEQPVLTRAGREMAVLSFPRRVRLERHVAAQFPELRPLLQRSAAARVVFRLDEVWPGCVAASAVPRLLVFPRFRRAGGLRWRPVSPTDALARLLQDDHFIWYRQAPWARVSQEHLALFQQLVCRVPAATLDYGAADIPRVPALLSRYLRTAMGRRSAGRGA